MRATSGPPAPPYAGGMGTALVTGATSGLGLEFAWQLAAARHDVVLLARREGLLRDAAREIHDVAGVRTEILVADLAAQEGRDLATARLRAEHPTGEVVGERLTGIDRPAPVGLLVNNAGFGMGQQILGGNLDHELAGLDVMVRSVLELSHVAANAMVARERGAILNVSSATALTAMGTYAAHKMWVRTFTESLASELRGTGVSATSLHPGLVRTGFHDASGQDAAAYPGFAFLRADEVVAAALEGVRRGEVLVTPSLMYKAVNAGLRLAPRRLVRRVAGAGLTGAAL